MTQHDMNIANQGAAAFRTDLNNALLSLVTLSSGTTAPSTTFAGMLWRDTTNSLYKQRNAADNGWITLWAHDKGGFVPQDGSSIYAADAGSSDTYVITLSPAPTAYTIGMVVNFKANTLNTGTATINVNALGAVTIKKQYNQDLATGDIVANQIVSLIYDGTNFQMQSPVAAATTSTLQYLGTSGAISGATSVDFTSGTYPSWFDGTYNDLEFRFIRVKPTTDSVNFWTRARVSSTFLNTNEYDYINNGRDAGSDTARAGSAASQAQLILNVSTTIGNNTNEFFSGKARLGVVSSGEWKELNWATGHRGPTGVGNSSCGQGWVKTTSALDGIRFLMSSGTIASGEIKVYGVKAS